MAREEQPARFPEPHLNPAQLSQGLRGSPCPAAGGPWEAYTLLLPERRELVLLIILSTRSLAQKSTVGTNCQDRHARKELFRQRLSWIQNTPLKHQICSSYNQQICASYTVRETDNSLLMSANVETWEEGR